MIKLKRSRTQRTCYACGKDIEKGDQYGSMRVRVGESASWTADSRPSEEIPPYAFQPFYGTVHMCEKCVEVKNDVL